MKKLTFLVSNLGGGGAERVTVLLANYFCKKDYLVNLIVFSHKNNDYEVDKNVQIKYLPCSKNKIEDVLKKIHTLKHILKEQNPDYVVSLGFSHRYLFFGSMMNKYKFILSERNAPQLFYKTWYEKFMVKYCFERAYKVVFQTEDAKNFYNELIQSKSKVILNPIREDLPNQFKGIRDKRIVAVSRLHEQKNLPMMFCAFKIFLKKYPDYILEIYGEGELKDKLIEYANELGILENVKFMGYTNNVHDKILNAAMFVSSSDYEGISNSMLESMAIGLPVVCTDCPAGGARMVIKNSYNGLLTTVGNEFELSDAMIKIAENPEEAQIMGSRASLLRDELSIDTIAIQWEELMK